MGTIFPNRDKRMTFLALSKYENMIKLSFRATRSQHAQMNYKCQEPWCSAVHWELSITIFSSKEKIVHLDNWNSSISILFLLLGVRVSLLFQLKHLHNKCCLKHTGFSHVPRLLHMNRRESSTICLRRIDHSMMNLQFWSCLILAVRHLHTKVPVCDSAAREGRFVQQSTLHA